MADGATFNARLNGVLAAIVAALCVSGCATELTFRRREALDSFVGRDKAALVAQLGEPTRTYEQSGKQFLTYDVHYPKWISGQPGTRNAEGFTLAPWVDNVSCETTFRLAGGRVDAWKLNGNDCRSIDFPPQGTNIASALNQVSENGVDRTANFPHDSYTDRSMVNYGEFQTK
jgi:hypothetical protein